MRLEVFLRHLKPQTTVFLRVLRELCGSICFATEACMVYDQMVMTVRVNGEDRDLRDGTTVAALIDQLHLTADKVAVELNRRLIRSEKYDTPLKPGDEVEIVTFVGGG